MSAEVDNYEFETYNEEDVMEKTVKKTGKRRYYPSNKAQMLIRNAVTGVNYPYLVGSNEQRRLYKMIDTTGTCNSEGFIIKTKCDLPNPNPNHLFYDSPEQCMGQLRIVIPPDAIAKWRERLQSINS